jgi:hypothetical protein
VYALAVERGNHALDEKNAIEAQRAEELATNAAEYSCIRKISDAHAALRRGVALDEIAARIVRAEKLLSTKRFEEALDALASARILMNRYSVPVTEEFLAREKVAAESVVMDYSLKAKEKLANGAYRGALTHVRGARDLAEEYGVTIPAELGEVAVALLAKLTEVARELDSKNDIPAAYEHVQEAEYVAEKFGLVLPDELFLIRRRGLQVRIDRFFKHLDGKFSRNELTREDFNSWEIDACKEVATLPIPLPDRCKKHVGTKQ